MIPQVYAIDLSKDFGPARSFNTIASLVNLFVPLVMVIAAMLTLIMFLWGGYTFVTAGGDPEKISHAQKTFLFSIIGLVIVVISFLVAKLIGKIFGVVIL